MKASRSRRTIDTKDWEEGRLTPAGIERDQSNGIMLSDDVTGVVHCIQTLQLRTNITKRVKL